MKKEELKIQKKLVSIFLELEEEIEATRYDSNKFGYQQRNELVRHVYSNYQNHEKLNEKREEWRRSRLKGNVLQWIYDLFREKRDLYGYFENPNQITTEIESLLKDAVSTERYEIAQELQRWLNKIKKIKTVHNRV